MRAEQIRHALIEVRVKSRNRVEGERNRKCADRYAQLENCEYSKWSASAIGCPASQPRSEREPSHETGEHGARGIDRDAEDKRKQAKPGYLIDKRRQTRQEKKGGKKSKHDGSMLLQSWILKFIHSS
jgi:hypothetical protein